MKRQPGYVLFLMLMMLFLLGAVMSAVHMISMAKQNAWREFVKNQQIILKDYSVNKLKR